MPPGGGGRLFEGQTVASLRSAVLSDIRTRAGHLDPESRAHIPEEMFLVGVLGQYDLSLPTLYFDRVYSRDVVSDGTRYLEIHVPMVGRPTNLDLAPTGGDLADVFADAFEYEIVDGDLCVFVELSQNRPDEIDVLTDQILAVATERYEALRRELAALRRDAHETAVRRYRIETDDRRTGYVL